MQGVIFLVSSTKHCKNEMVKGDIVRRRVIAGARDIGLLAQFQLHLDLSPGRRSSTEKMKKKLLLFFFVCFFFSSRKGDYLRQY